ncbi:MAG: glycosyltransferase family 2 protein [Rikenellaceae bacterium]
MKLGVVILNFATYNDTTKLVEQLQEQTIIDRIQIVVVDNYSPNESYRVLKPLEDRFQNVVVVQTDENLGYAKGNNFGLKYLEDSVKPNYVAILNNDVAVSRDLFENIVARYKLLENPAIVAPIMCDRDGRRQTMMSNLPSIWSDFKMLFAFYNKFLQSKKERVLCDNTGHNAMSVEVIGGSFMFVEFEKFKAMGYFYPNTFLYVEERFVAEAAKRLGYKNYLILDMEYIHDHTSPSISSYHNQISKYKILYKSRLEYVKVCKKHGKLKVALLKPFMLWSLFEWWVIGVVKLVVRR